MQEKSRLFRVINHNASATNREAAELPGDLLIPKGSSGRRCQQPCKVQSSNAPQANTPYSPAGPASTTLGWATTWFPRDGDKDSVVGLGLSSIVVRANELSRETMVCLMYEVRPSTWTWYFHFYYVVWALLTSPSLSPPNILMRATWQTLLTSLSLNLPNPAETPLRWWFCAFSPAFIRGAGSSLNCSSLM